MVARNNEPVILLAQFYIRHSGMPGRDASEATKDEGGTRGSTTDCPDDHGWDSAQKVAKGMEGRVGKGR